MTRGCLAWALWSTCVCLLGLSGEHPIDVLLLALASGLVLLIAANDPPKRKG